MGRMAANVPAPVPAQLVSIKARWVRAINGAGAGAANASVKSTIPLSMRRATTEIATTNATDMMAEYPHGPKLNRRVTTTTARVATPQDTAKYVWLVAPA